MSAARVGGKAYLGVGRRYQYRQDRFWNHRGIDGAGALKAYWKRNQVSVLSHSLIQCRPAAVLAAGHLLWMAASGELPMTYCLELKLAMDRHAGLKRAD